MANQPFDREIINQRERPLSTDINLAASYADASMRQMWFETWDGQQRQPDSAGFIGRGFYLSPSAGMVLSCHSGVGYWNNATASELNIGGVSGLSDFTYIKPLVLNANTAITVPAADPVNPRYDVLEVTMNRQLTDSSSRDVLNPTTGQFVATNVNKTLSYALDGSVTVNGAGALNYKTGTPAASPTVPTVTAGYEIIAIVRVEAAAVAITQDKIQDRRTLLFPQGMCHVAASVQTGAGVAVSLLSTAVAPPTVEIGFVPVSATQAVGYIKAGKATDFLAQSVSITANSPGGASAPYGTSAALPSVFTMDAPTQAALAASGAPLTVAVGQPVIQFTLHLSAAVLPASATYDVTALLQA